MPIRIDQRGYFYPLHNFSAEEFEFTKKMRIGISAKPILQIPCKILIANLAIFEPFCFPTKMGMSFRKQVRTTNCTQLNHLVRNTDSVYDILCISKVTSCAFVGRDSMNEKSRSKQIIFERWRVFFITPKR